MTIQFIIKELIERYGSRNAYKYVNACLEGRKIEVEFDDGDQLKHDVSILDMLGHTEYVLFSKDYNSSIVVDANGEKRRVDEYFSVFFSKFTNAVGLAWTEFAGQSGMFISDKSDKAFGDVIKDGSGSEGAKLSIPVLSPERLRAEWAAISENCFDGKLVFHPISKSPVLLSEINVIKVNQGYVALKDDAKVSDYFDAYLYGFKCDAMEKWCSQCLYGKGDPNDDAIIEYLALTNGISCKLGAYSVHHNDDVAKPDNISNGGE